MSSFFILEDGAQCGPFSESDIFAKIQEGRLTTEDYIWAEGMPDWVQIKNLQFSSQPKEENKPKTGGSNPFNQIQNLVCWVSGLSPLNGFRISDLFSSVLKKHSSDEVDRYFNCGCENTTPPLADLDPNWPRPWYYFRMLLAGFAILAGFIAGTYYFQNAKLIPGIILVGAFFVPLSCVMFFYELNVPRNISIYQVFKVVVGGGLLSLLASLFLYQITDRQISFLGAMSAGIVEEIGKALAAIFILRGAAKYKWILNGMLVGASVGAGFAGFESAGYIFERLNSDTEFFNTLFLRALLAPFCHVIWTACVLGALWRVKGDQPFRFSMLFQYDFLRVLAFVMGLHMLWNSGLLFDLSAISSSRWRLELYMWLLSFAGSWYLVLLLVQTGLNQIKISQSQAGCFKGASATQDVVDPHHSEPQRKSQPVLIAALIAIILVCSVFVYILVIQSEKPGTRPSDTGTEQKPSIAGEGKAPSPPISLPFSKNIAMDSPYENSLGMKFVPVPGTNVLFSVWDTRRKDYEVFVQESGYTAFDGWKTPMFQIGANPRDQQTGDHPVVNISWEDAKAFCKWLTAKEHGERRIGRDQEYRLPTDTEWSVAVGLPEESGFTPQENNSKVKGVYPWGTQWPPPQSAGNYARTRDSFGYTSPVGSFPANTFGLFDMGGNVLQWCENWYSGEHRTRVLRGSWWVETQPEDLLSSRRQEGVPEVHNDTNGFRCVLGSSR